MGELPLGLALSAGILAAVNPCGFALLPAYISFLVVGDDQPRRMVAVGRALLLTVAMTAGFAAVFGLFGLAIMPVASTVPKYLPWFTIVLGLFLAALGGWLLAGRALPSLKLGRGPALTRSVPSMVLFGGAYAVASLGCTIGPFLAIVVSTFRADETTSGVWLFAAYAGGMGLVVGAVSLAAALARQSVVTRMRQAGRWVPRAGGVLLLVAGAYVAYYGWYEIRSQEQVIDDPIINAAQSIQEQLARSVDWLGAVGIVAIVAALIVLGVARSSRRARS